MKAKSGFWALVVATTILGLGCEEAVCQGLPPMPMMCLKRFGELDSDRDGRISLEEFKAVSHPEGRPEAIFKLRDLNRDGYLSKEEFCLGRKKKTKSREGGGREQ